MRQGGGCFGRCCWPWGGVLNLPARPRSGRCRCACEESRPLFVLSSSGRAACYSSPSPPLLAEQERHGRHHTGVMDEDMKLFFRLRSTRR
ncbi:hypothetical protein ACQJBY_039742 [Aegilops geniculata]